MEKQAIAEQSWLRRLDSALFRPPHTFEEVLALVSVHVFTMIEEKDGRTDNNTVETTTSASEPRPHGKQTL